MTRYRILTLENVSTLLHVDPKKIDTISHWEGEVYIQFSSDFCKDQDIEKKVQELQDQGITCSYSVQNFSGIVLYDGDDVLTTLIYPNAQDAKKAKQALEDEGITCHYAYQRRLRISESRNDTNINRFIRLVEETNKKQLVARPSICRNVK